MFLNSQTDSQTVFKKNPRLDLRIYYLGIWEPGRNSDNFFRNLRMIPGTILPLAASGVAAASDGQP